MRKDVKIMISIGTFLILAAFLIFSFQKVNLKEKPGTPIKQEISTGVTLIVDFGGGEVERFDREPREGMTAFDLLKEGAGRLNLSLETKTYDMGIFIEVIGDKKNGQEGKYWLYYVNDEMPMVSADKKEIKPGDKVEFKFEESPF